MHNLHKPLQQHPNLHKQNTLTNINLIPSKYNVRQKGYDY